MIIKISDKLRDDKGVTLITLIIAITIFAIFITVFSYVMVAKHGSATLYVQSTQAYAVAQAGIEYGIRCAQDSGCWDYTTTATLEKDFGGGSFTLVYDDSNNTLTSTGTVGVAERAIILSSFSGYVEAAVGIVLGDQPSSGQGSNKNIIYVPLINNYDYDVYIYEIKLAKEGGTQAQMEYIKFGVTTVWAGSLNVSNDPGSLTDFPFNQVSYHTIIAQGSDTLSLYTSNKNQVGGTWYCTFLYSKQSDLSDPQSSSVKFDM